ncbi:MAG: hypothetical protein OSJ83_03795 [Clostridia bacterium]|nr:hypothetical protein [Clostridia bacterium]
MSNIGCLHAIWNTFVKLSGVYDRMTPERRAKTKYFGIYSIITSIVASGVFVLCMWGILTLVPAIDTSGLGAPLIIMFIVILAACELVLLANIVLGGVMGIIYQRRCNSHPIAWIALAILIVCVAGTVVGILLILDATM